MRITRSVTVAAGALLIPLLAACSDAQPAAGPVTPTFAASTSSSPTVSPPAPVASADATITAVPLGQWRRIVTTGTWRPGCPVGRDQLRRVEVNHYDFAGQIHRGVLIVNVDVATDIADVFSALFAARFPITRMVPAEEYNGDAQRTLLADSTSAFNCRRPNQINAPVALSPHANGRAIDINPYRNPWRDLRCDCWQPSADFAKNRSGPGVITKDSLPHRLLIERGWIWQNIKVPDYMHFDTGYPSRPRPAPSSPAPSTGEQA